MAKYSYDFKLKAFAIHLKMLPVEKFVKEFIH